MTIPKLAKIKATDYSKVIERIEDCLVNAKSAEAKRILYETGLDLAYLDYAYEGWEKNYLAYKEKQANEKQGWSWKSLSSWSLWKTNKKENERQ